MNWGELLAWVAAHQEDIFSYGILGATGLFVAHEVFGWHREPEPSAMDKCIALADPGPEPETWCAGCDGLVPVSQMGWDKVGLVGRYRCRTCRGEPQYTEAEITAWLDAEQAWQLQLWCEAEHTWVKQQEREAKLQQMRDREYKERERAKFRGGHWEWNGMGREWVEEPIPKLDSSYITSGSMTAQRADAMVKVVTAFGAPVVQYGPPDRCKPCGDELKFNVDEMTYAAYLLQLHNDARCDEYTCPHPHLKAIAAPHPWLTGTIKDVTTMPGVVIPLYSPPTDDARKHNMAVVCSTCECTGNHLAYECPQRGHATVITGAGRVREMTWQDQGAGPVAI